MKLPSFICSRRLAPPRILRILFIAVLLCMGWLAYYRNGGTDTKVKLHADTFLVTSFTSFEVIRQPNVPVVVAAKSKTFLVAPADRLQADLAQQTFRDKEVKKSFEHLQVGMLPNAERLKFNNQQPSNRLNPKIGLMNIIVRATEGTPSAPLQNPAKWMDKKDTILEKNVVKKKLNCSGVAAPPSERVRETYEWQKVGGDLFLYAAHYDSRSFSPVVVIIGVMANYMSMYNARQHGFCYAWYKGDTEPVVIEARISILPEDHGYKYGATFHKCPLSRGDKVPYAVSFSIDRCQEPSVLLKVVSQDTKHKPDCASQPDDCDPSDDLMQEEESAKDTINLPSSLPYVNFTVCVNALNHHFNDHLQLIEMIEVNRMFGAQRFVFYNYSTASDVVPYFRSYEAEGIAQVLPWHLPMFVRDEPTQPGGVDSDIHSFGQMASLNDCLYRNMFSSRFLVITDLDELIVPRRHNTWMELIRDASSRHGSGATSDATPTPYYLARNVFFRCDWENDTSMANRTDVHRLRLRTLLTTSREAKIFEYNQRSKYIATTRQATLLGIHFVYEFAGGAHVNLYEHDALVHHYRPTMWPEDPNVSRQAVRDTFMHKHATAILRRTSDRMELVKRNARIDQR